MPDTPPTSAAGLTVYVLDWVGYDARGGNAEVYATLESAMATETDPWTEVEDGEWETGVDHGTAGTPVIYRMEVKP